MRREMMSLISVRFVAIIGLVLALVGVVVLGQGDGEKTLDDAMQLFAEGMAAYDQERFHDAIELYEEALVIGRQLGWRREKGKLYISLWTAEEHDILNYLGRCYDSLLDHEQAIDYYEQSLVIARKFGDRASEAGSLNSLGVCRFWYSDYQRAIAYHEQSLMICREIKHRRGEAANLLNLGNCYQSVSDYERAIGYHEQSWVIFREIGAWAGAANCLNGLGVCYFRLSDYQRAIDCHEQALAIFREIADHAGEAANLLNLGNCYQSLSDYQRAIDYQEEALAIFREIGNQVGEANSLNNLGYCHGFLSNYQLAIDYIEQSLVIAREIGDREGEAAGLHSLGSCYVSLSDYRQAIGYHAQALVICREIGDRAGEAICLGSLGSCYLGLFDHQRAIGYYERSLALSVDLRTLEEEWCTQWGLGRATHEMEDLTGAVTHYEAAIEIVEAIRGAVGEEELRQSYFGSVRTLYEEYLELLLDTGRIEETLFVAERLRARTFLDLVAGGPGLPDVRDIEQGIEGEDARRGGFPTEEYSRPRTMPAFFLDLGGLRPVVLREFGGSPVSPASFLTDEPIISEQVELPDAPRYTLENVGEEGIRSGVVEASVIEADLAEVVASLPESTAAIEYFVTEDTTYLWLITGGVTDEPLRIDIPRSELREDVLEFRKAIESGSTGLTDPPDEATFTMSRDLYELLIAPVEDRLDGIDHLIIVPSGPLYYLPFCALLDCEDCEGAAFFGGEYLVEPYAISYTPSLTVLKYARALAGTVLPDSLFLALADPAGEDPSLQRLPEAQDEAQAAAGLFDPSEVYVDTAATEDIILARASSASQLLLSTHGKFNPSNPMFSYLLLSPTEDNDDGRLYAYEVFGLDLHADLVTLSACETLLPALKDATAQVRAVRGAGEDEEVELDERLLATLTAGDEIVGLTRAFICAGTPSVLSTLWKVVSEPTKSLMMAFYGYLGEGMSKVRALQRAQLDILASYRHPRYWAAFSLFGDWGEESSTAAASLAKLSPELLDAWLAWQSQAHGPDDEPPLIAVVITMTKSMTVELLGVISGLSEEIAIKGSFGHFVEADVPLNLLLALCGLQEIESVTPPWMTTNSA